MKVGKSWLVFLTMLVITVCIVALAAERPLTASWNAEHGISDSCDWQCVGTGSGKTAAAAGWENGELVLRYFTTDGKKLSLQRITLPEECENGTISRLLPIRDGFAYLCLYSVNAEKLFLYRVHENGDLDRLLAEDCNGSSFSVRTARTRLSELLFEDDVMSFALWKDNTLECYLCRETGGLEAVPSEETTDARTLSVLTSQDGRLMQGGTGLLRLNEHSADSLVAGQSVTILTQCRGGWYYIDAVRFELCYVDAALGATYRLLSLNTKWNKEAKSLTSAAITQEESVLMLLDGTVLTVSDADGSRELSGILRPASKALWVIVLIYAAIALAAAVLLWILLCGLRRGYAPLAVQRGCLFLAFSLLCAVVLRYAVLRPAAQSSAQRENDAVVSAILRTEDAEQRINDDRLKNDIASMLEDAEHGENARVTRAVLSDGTWRSMDGRNAVTLEGFSPELADAALKNGSASTLHGNHFRYVLVKGDQCISICSDVPGATEDHLLYGLLLGCFGLLTLAALLILVSISKDIRKISRKMESLSQGKASKPLKLHTSDELESMASIVNSLGDAMKTQEEDVEHVKQSYRRFVPEKVLALLGKGSIQNVDKSDFASRRMVMMTVRFSFPESLYTDAANSRLLFDSVNEVIDRTASIVTRKGGTVYHFAYNGFDLVMEDSGEAVSTAVAIQQEVLSLNETRAQSRLPGVTLRIALDRGSFMLGIVGDASTLTPTTISSSLSVVQELIDLCEQLKAGILCTESIIAERSDYSNRYMGKCIVGDQPVRVYEVFDGDDFNTRRGKASSINEFSKGVYDLYAGDNTGAKRTFLQLAHNYPMDGGARYYLHLADRLEHDPTLPCVLNLDRADGGEM